jgi:hypothetical protein
MLQLQNAFGREGDRTKWTVRIQTKATETRLRVGLAGKVRDILDGI